MSGSVPHNLHAHAGSCTSASVVLDNGTAATMCNSSPKFAPWRCAPAMTPPRKKSPLSSSVRRLGADAERDAGREKVSAIAVCISPHSLASSDCRSTPPHRPIPHRLTAHCWLLQWCAGGLKIGSKPYLTALLVCRVLTIERTGVVLHLCGVGAIRQHSRPVAGRCWGARWSLFRLLVPCLLLILVLHKWQRPQPTPDDLHQVISISPSSSAWSQSCLLAVIALWSIHLHATHGFCREVSITQSCCAGACRCMQ